MMISASASLLLAIMALSNSLSASILLSKSSIYFCRVLSFMLVRGSTSADGFLRRSSAFVYSVQIYALRELWLALSTTLHAPSANLIMPCFTAMRPHSASLSSQIAASLDV